MAKNHWCYFHCRTRLCDLLASTTKACGTHFNKVCLLQVNPELPATPFCSLWMIMSNSRQDKVRIFHPLIFGASCYVSCVPYPIEKSPLEVFFFVLEWILKKKTDDHIVYFFNLTIFDKIQFKQWIWPLLHLNLTKKTKITEFGF
jgi:hypothetical protein